MSYRGFYKRQRRILEYLDAGTIGLLDLAVHDLICMKANWAIGADALLPPGIWKGSAKAIHVLGRRGSSERTVRRSLDRLEKLGLIKRWKTTGKHGNYPILVEGFCVRDVSGNEYVVNAKETADWRQPKLEPVRDLSNPCPDADREPSARKELRRSKNSHRPPSKQERDRRRQPGQARGGPPTLADLYRIAKEKAAREQIRVAS